MNLPTPPLTKNPARNDVRARWIGRNVRYHRKHLRFRPRTAADQKFQELCLARDTGVVLEVGRAMWLLIRWSNGDEGQEHKMDIELAYSPSVRGRH